MPGDQFLSVIHQQASLKTPQGCFDLKLGEKGRGAANLGNSPNQEKNTRRGERQTWAKR